MANVLDDEYETLDFADESEYIGPDEDECQGHESLKGSEMGVTVFCDGTCQS